MFFEEPKVEYIEFGKEDIIVTSGDGGNIESCNGPDAPSNKCSDFMN